MHVAKEMEREGFTVPLLIGGATTSRTHTAVKIAPAYRNAVVHVQDASRAVGVMGNLVSRDLRTQFRGRKSPGAGAGARKASVAEGPAPAFARGRAAQATCLRLVRVYAAAAVVFGNARLQSRAARRNRSVH